MKTEDLIEQLSHAPTKRPMVTPTMMLTLAVIVAMAVAVLLSFATLKPRAADVGTITLALKLAFGLGVALSTLPIVRDLCIPGRRLGMRSFLAAAPFAAIAIVAASELAAGELASSQSAMPTRGWSHHDSLASWLECLWLIPALAIPAFLILLTAARHLAPTNLRKTGASLGLAAGGIGAIGYALHCDHNSIALVAVFYTVAIVEMAMAGFWLGPRCLRWAAPAPSAPMSGKAAVGTATLPPGCRQR